ncbi:MAG: T9SS type A sorting domain-containing protein [Flavobacterium sp.]|nr:T9SS type A sorting domain-containing protein [Flavobacterium sp.]
MKKIILLLTIGFALTTQTLLAQVPSYVPTNGLVSYWPFSGNANDQSGNGNNGAVNGATLTTDRFGNTNSAYNFNGSSTVQDYLIANNPISNQESFTISYWVSRADINFTKYHLMINDNSNSTGTYELFSRNDTIYFRNFAGVPGAGVNFDLKQRVQIPNNSAFNVCVTSDNNVTKLFINGIQYQQTSIQKIKPTLGLIYFGMHPNFNIQSNNSFNGKLDDIGIWNRALSQEEITAMYNGVTYSDNCNAVSGSLTQGLVGYWPFCGNANDDSGNGNNGTVNGASLTTDRFGNTNSAYSFDGLSNYIDLNKQIPNIFSISLWVSVSSFKTYIAPGNNIIGSTMIGTFNNNFEFSGFACATSGVTNQYGQHFAAFWNPNPNTISVTATTNLSLNQWKNLIITYDGTNLKYYVNGVLEGNSNAIFTQNQMDLFVGARQFHLNGPDFFFNGKIDDIGIWNRALNETEITQLYNQNQCITNITVTDTLIINVGQLSFENPILYANNITIFPNPASTQININFNNITDLTGGTINIINSLGQQVATTSITTTGTNSTMSLSTWGGTGLYFVQILNPQGQIVDIKKILLQ